VNPYSCPEDTGVLFFPVCKRTLQGCEGFLHLNLCTSGVDELVVLLVLLGELLDSFHGRGISSCTGLGGHKLDVIEGVAP
jgi:hypothetical protein